MDWRHRNRVVVIMPSRTIQNQISSPGFGTRPRSSNHLLSTKTEIVHYYASKFGKAITRGWVDSFLLRHKDDLVETVSKPQDNPCLQVPQEFLLGTISGMEEAVQDCVRDLVFSLDEVRVRVSEWEDLKSKKIVAPTAMCS
jgi:hypothetical protein